MPMSKVVDVMYMCMYMLGVCSISVLGPPASTTINRRRDYRLVVMKVTKPGSK